jgi:hypothetical protein
MPDQNPIDYRAPLSPCDVTIAVGPEHPADASCERLVADMAAELAKHFRTSTYSTRVPDCDVVLAVKYPLSTDMLRSLPAQVRVVYLPIDFFGGCHDIDRTAPALARCSGIIVHGEKLRKYFQSYARVYVLDLHTMYAVERLRLTHSRERIGEGLTAIVKDVIAKQAFR